MCCWAEPNSWPALTVVAPVVDRRELADGGVAGDATGTNIIPMTPRITWAYRTGSRSKAARLPAAMAARQCSSEVTRITGARSGEPSPTKMLCIGARCYTTPQSKKTRPYSPTRARGGGNRAWPSATGVPATLSA